MVVLD
jgi:hypothetical protein